MEILRFVVGFFLGALLAIVGFVPFFYGLPRAIRGVRSGRLRWGAIPYQFLRPALTCLALVACGYLGESQGWQWHRPWFFSSASSIGQWLGFLAGLTNLWMVKSRPVLRDGFTQGTAARFVTDPAWLLNNDD